MNAPKSPPDNARDLHAALVACLDETTSSPTLPKRVVEFTAALTGASTVSLWKRAPGGTWTVVASVGAVPEAHAVFDAEAALAATESRAAFSGSFLAAEILVPETPLLLLIGLPSPNRPALALAYERVTFLAHLTQAKFGKHQSSPFTELSEAIGQVAQAPGVATQAVADALAGATRADYVSVGLWNGRRIDAVSLSGQAGLTKRSAELDVARKALADIARTMRRDPESLFVSSVRGDQDLVVWAPGGQNTTIPFALAAHEYAQSRGPRRGPRHLVGRAMRWGLVLAAVVALGALPIPDNAKISATVAAVETRVVTAPDTAVLARVLVAEGATVVEGQPLLELNAEEPQLNLLRVQAERAAAIIEQENARLRGDAAALRNAELTVARLEAQMRLEEARIEDAQQFATIDGIVSLDNLLQKVGTTVRQGEVLLTLAKPDALSLDLMILPGDLAKVKAGATGVFRPDFDPSQRLDARVAVISPAIDLTADAPFAPAEAALDGDTTRLRAGMTGVLHMGDRHTPLGQVVFDRLRRWWLLNVWL